MILGDKQKTSFVSNIDGKKINSFSEVDLLELVIDNQLKLKTHIENICRKALLEHSLLPRE